MDQTTPAADLLHNPLPADTGTLKTLTLLTFIGCGLGYVSLITGLFTNNDYEKQLAKAEEARDKMQDMGGLASKMTQGSVEMIQATHQYQWVIFGTTLLFTTLCLIGAMQMRNLKKSGFSLYVVGEIAPVIVTAVLLWVSLLGKITVVVSAIIALVFVLLYNNQRKHLVR